MALRTAGTRPRRFPSHTEVWWQRPDNIIIGLTLVATLAVATTFNLPSKTPPVTIVNGSPLKISLEVRPAGITGLDGARHLSLRPNDPPGGHRPRQRMARAGPRGLSHCGTVHGESKATG